MRLPIVVIGTGPRCGSTPYVELLSQQLGLPAFYEPWHYRINRSDHLYEKLYYKYLEFKNISNKYILKFFISDMEIRCPYYDEFNNGYKILLSRRDLVGQLSSWYIADSLDKFHTLVQEEERNYVVPINSKDISEKIRVLTRAVFLAEQCSSFDIRLYYEDIDFSALKSPYKKTIQPSNLAELRQEIEKQLKDTIPVHWIIDKSSSKISSNSL